MWYCISQGVLEVELHHSECSQTQQHLGSRQHQVRPYADSFELSYITLKTTKCGVWEVMQSSVVEPVNHSRQGGSAGVKPWLPLFVLEVSLQCWLLEISAHLPWPSHMHCSTCSSWQLVSIMVRALTLLLHWGLVGSCCSKGRTAVVVVVVELAAAVIAAVLAGVAVTVSLLAVIVAAVMRAVVWEAPVMTAVLAVIVAPVMTSVVWEAAVLVAQQYWQQ